VTVKFAPFTKGGVLTHADPSKETGSEEKPGQPTGNAGRTWAVGLIAKKVTV